MVRHSIPIDSQIVRCTGREAYSVASSDCLLPATAPWVVPDPAQTKQLEVRGPMVRRSPRVSVCGRCGRARGANCAGGPRGRRRGRVENGIGQGVEHGGLPVWDNPI